MAQGIFIPKSLQDEYLIHHHTGHFGISKCQARAKSTVYWPRIDKDIINLIGHCDTCRQVQHAPPLYNQHSVEACQPSHIWFRHSQHRLGASCCHSRLLLIIYKRPMPDTSSETIQRKILMLQEHLEWSEIYSKCKEEFPLGLLV